MTSSDSDELIKIGRSSKHPAIRAEQLTNQTSTIGEFHLEWYKEVNNSKFLETYLHYILKDFHYKKEYYLIDTLLAIEIIENSLDSLLLIEKNNLKTFKSKMVAYTKRLKALEILLKIEKDNNNRYRFFKRIDILKKIIEKLSISIDRN